MQHIDRLLTHEDVENKSIVIGFIKEDEEVLNENLRNILFDDSMSYSKFLRSKKPSTFNKYIRIDNEIYDKYYYIFLDTNEQKLDKYKYFANIMFIDMYDICLSKNIQSIHTYINCISDEKRNIILSGLNIFDNKLKINLYTNNIT